MKFPSYKDHIVLWWGIILVFLGSLISIFVLPFLFTRYSFISYTQTGQIGETINGIAGPFIALGAAILTFLAFYIQFRANKKQDKQFQDQNEANKLQRKGQAIQQFDSTFFNLVSNHSQIVNSIREVWIFDNATEKVPVEGREIFKKVVCAIKQVFNANFEIYRKAKWEFDNIANEWDKMKRANPMHFACVEFSQIPLGAEKLDTVSYHFYSTYRSAFSHYFRNLYHVIKFIVEYNGFQGLYDEKEINEIKGRYLKIIVAQLSSYELIMLWYNGRQEFGSKFGKLLKDYELLENIDFDAEIVLPELLRKEHPYLD